MAPGALCLHHLRLPRFCVFAFGKQQSAVTSGRLCLWAAREETRTHLSRAQASCDGVHLDCAWQRQPRQGASGVHVQSSGNKKGTRDTRPLRECGETWAHRALFLKKGLSEAELGSEPPPCPRPLTCARSGFTVPPACEMQGDAELGAEGCTPSPAVQRTDREGGCVQKTENQGARQRSDSPRVGRRPYNSQVLVTGRSSAKSSGPAPGKVPSWHVCPGPLCPPPRRLSVTVPSTPSHPHFSATAHAGEMVCGLGEPQAAAPPKDHAAPQHRAAHGLPSLVPGATFFSGSWPCSHTVSTSSRSLCSVPHTAHADGRKAQTCPATRPLPTLLPDPQRKESELGFRASSPAGLSPVSACVPIGVQTPTRTPTRTGARSGATLPTWQVRGSRPSPVPAALPPLCPPPHLPQ